MTNLYATLEKHHLCLPSPLHQLNHPTFDTNKLSIWVKRDDLIHPMISGNKWRKAKYALLYAKQQGYQGLVTMGGIYSNHLLAIAKLSQLLCLPSVGLIRASSSTTNAHLDLLQQLGMKLHWLNRREYRELRQISPYIRSFKHYPEYFFLPEGGSSSLALLGFKELISELSMSFDYLLTPLASGGTLAGLIRYKPDKLHIIAIPVLKPVLPIINHVESLVGPINSNEVTLYSNYHFGGYARCPLPLINFCESFYKITTLPIEPIYSGKLFYALMELINHNTFPKGSRILCLHTGGIFNGLSGLIEANTISQQSILNTILSNPFYSSVKI